MMTISDIIDDIGYWMVIYVFYCYFIVKNESNQNNKCL